MTHSSAAIKVYKSLYLQNTLGDEISKSILVKIYKFYNMERCEMIKFLKSPAGTPAGSPAGDPAGYPAGYPPGFFQFRQKIFKIIERRVISVLRRSYWLAP